MLVLSRKVDEEVVIPELDITIRVIKVQGNKVKLGVEAPDSVKICRAEIIEKRSPVAAGNGRGDSGTPKESSPPVSHFRLRSLGQVS